MCAGFVIAAGAALALVLLGETGLAVWFAGLAGALFLLVWSKWRFDPRRLLIAPAVPFVLLVALLRGRRRAATDQRARTS